MKRKLVEHSVSILLVTALFSGLILYIQNDGNHKRGPGPGLVQQYVQLPFVDFGDPLDEALFKDVMRVFYPQSPARNDSLIRAIAEYRREQFTNVLYKTGSDLKGLTWSKANALLGMYLQFIFIYLIVLGLSYYGAQTLGTLRFVQMKQNRSSVLVELLQHVGQLVRGTRAQRTFRSILRIIRLLLKTCVKGILYLFLFAPAYVIAYSFKTKVETDSSLFMVLLGVISNGLLINYANRFYTFLVAESRKGYVETAMVKNLNRSYEWNEPDGITRKSVLRLRKSFPSHVFDHIYLNARHQFHHTLKEHASFLITGLVIIEMALNIQGHLSYEMLKNILYRQYDVVLGILLCLFLLVKATDMIVDFWTERDGNKYENR